MTAQAARLAAGRAGRSGWHSRTGPRRLNGPQIRLKPRPRPSAPSRCDAVPCCSMSTIWATRACADGFVRALSCT
eukprot:4741816-Prymnesium_polylepis.1